MLAGDDGRSTATGGGAAWACASLSAVTATPVRTAPPFATPDWTVRVSLIELTTVPVGSVNAVFSTMALDPVVGETMVV